MSSTFDSKRFPALFEIAVLVAKAPIAQARADRFPVCLDLWQRGYAEVLVWCEENRRFALCDGDVDQPNFIWRGMPIVPDISAGSANVAPAA